MPCGLCEDPFNTFISASPDSLFDVYWHMHALPAIATQAFVEFVKEVYASDALQFHKMNMGSRYVEIFKSNRFEMTQVSALTANQTS